MWVGILVLLLWTCELCFAGKALFPDIRESHARPFWIERSAFVHENCLFAVGIASDAKTPEAGRLTALETAKQELQSFLKRLSSEMIETKDTYEELNSNGSYTVYRLVMIPLTDLPEVVIADIEREARKHEAENRRKVETAKQLWLKEKADAEARYYEELTASLRTEQLRKQEDAKRERKAREEGFGNEALWKALEAIHIDIKERINKYPSNLSATIHKAFDFQMNAVEGVLKDHHVFEEKLKMEQMQYGKEQEYIIKDLENCLAVRTGTPQGARWSFCVERAESNYEYVKKVGIAEVETLNKESSAFWDEVFPPDSPTESPIQNPVENPFFNPRIPFSQHSSFAHSITVNFEPGIRIRQRVKDWDNLSLTKMSMKAAGHPDERSEIIGTPSIYQWSAPEGLSRKAEANQRGK